MLKKLYKGLLSLLGFPFYTYKINKKINLLIKRTDFIGGIADNDFNTAIISLQKLQEIHNVYRKKIGIFFESQLNENIDLFQPLDVVTKPNTNEELFLKNFLKNKLPQKSNLMMFDVGANSGVYTWWFSKYFKNSIIHAFEPGKVYDLLIKNLQGINCTINHFALSDEDGEIPFYVYDNDPTNAHGSLFRGVDEIYKVDDSLLKKFTIRAKKLDDYCTENNIDYIDYLKIDAEGMDLKVLKGAKNLIEKDKIGIIQFEFNEMNIITRTFIRDYYQILQSFDFYRILEDGSLFSMGNYHPKLEVFSFQNIIAINRNTQNI